MSVTQASTLAPSATQLDRHVAVSCLGLTVAGAARGLGCVGPDAGSPPQLAIEPACAAGALALVGALPQGTRSVRLLLADGRRVTSAPVDLGAGAGGRPALAYVPPAGTGVRSLTLEPSGFPVDVQAPPARTACGGEAGALGALPQFLALGLAGLDPASLPVTGAPPRAVLAGAAVTVPTGAGGGLLLADGPGGSTCVGVRPGGLRAPDCGTLGRAPGALLVRTRASADGRRLLVAGLTGASATAVRVATASADGAAGSVRVATAPLRGSALAGRAVAFAVALPTGVLPRALLAVDSAGAPLATDAGTPPFDLAALRPVGVRVRAGAPAGLRAFSATLGAAGADAPACGAVTGGPTPAAPDLTCLTGYRTTQVTVTASCARRTTVLAAAVGVARTTLVVRTTAGRTISGRRVALGGRAGLLVAVLGPRDAARSVTVDGPGVLPERRTLDLPAAAAQCGVRATLTVR